MKASFVKRLFCGVLIASMAAGTLAGCGASTVVDAIEDVSAAVEEPTPEPTEEPTPEPTEAATPEPTPEPVVEEEEESVPPEGMYFSELTGEPIDLEMQDQRPIAVMVDNETTAYDHFGIAECDVVYEIMNSQKNGYITRLMCLRKDWQNIQQMGSIRSVRTTNIWLASEWNAVICHDGGPHYIQKWIEQDYTDHFSGTFSRVNNGKAREFTEYILPGDLERNFSNSGISTTYNEFKPERDSHFLFVPYETETDLTNYKKAKEVTSVGIPYEHTNSRLEYNTETGTYDFYCYGKQHVDGEDGEALTFKNVILQKVNYILYDDAGYMWFDVCNNKDKGYYITNGHAIPITWEKEGETGITKYYDKKGNEIKLNRGKTYIGSVAHDHWDRLTLE